MKTKKSIAAAVLASTFVVFSLAAFYPLDDQRWRSETIYSGDPDFVQMEIMNGRPNVAFSTDKGIILAEKQTDFWPFEQFVRFSDWSTEDITPMNNSGFYLSMKEIDGELAMAHQYSGLGDRKLGYTARVNGSWHTDQVDSMLGTGLEPGMYTSMTDIEGEPLIFYHTAGGDKFVRADRNGSDWKKEVLNTDTGWYISSDSCGERAHVMYISRERNTLNKGEATRSGWETEELDGITDSATSVDATGCTFRAAYHNPDTGKINYQEGDEAEEVTDGKLSRLSLDYNQIPRISYYHYGKGLFYAEKEDGSWNSMLVDNNWSYTGEYNDMETFGDGTPAIAYTTDSKVIYTEYSRGRSEQIKTVIQVIAFLLLAPAIFSVRELEDELKELKTKLF